VTEANGRPEEPDEELEGPDEPALASPPEALAHAGAVEPAPQEISELVAVCTEAVRRAIGVELDFSPETLPLLDHYVSIARVNAGERPELLPLVSRTVGAYFGEVVRHNIRGFWRMPSANVHDWAVCARPVFLWINPIGAAFDALAAGTEHEGPRSQLHVASEYREAVNARLAALPEVSDEEYVSLSTRLEVIQIAVDTLATEMRAQGYEETEYELADYEAELNPLASL
jgi:hypothetical protein